MSVRSRIVIGGLALLVLAIRAQAQTSVIQGHISGPDGKPLKGAEIVLQRQDAKAAPVSARSDARGDFVAGTLPVGSYRINIRVNGEDTFAAAKLITRVGDPLRIEYDMKHAVVTMGNATSKKIRRFAWQEAATGSHTDGRWVETYGVDGYEAPSARTERKDGRAMKHIQDMSGAGAVPPGGH
jgi:hypothetical protein